MIERRVRRDARVEAITMSEPESDFYNLVTSAIRQYAKDSGVSDGFLLATPQRQLSSCMYAAAHSWGADAAGDVEELLYEDLGATAAPHDTSRYRQYLLSYIAGKFDMDALWAADSKFQRLAGVLKEYFGRFPDEKVVLFSYFRGTLRYLQQRLRNLGVPTTILMGDMGVEKSEVIDRFRTDPTVRLLLSSEVASEGVDLQFCRFLVNYDLPWNPMRVEQRIGRIDRLGQAADKISILNLVYDQTIDSRILSRLYERLSLFEQALGGMESVVGEKIQQLTTDLLTGRLTPAEEEERIAQTALALENNRRSEEALEAQASQLLAHSQQILHKVRSAHGTRQISENDLWAYTRDYLDRFAPGHRFVQLGDDRHEVEIALPPATAARLDRFLKARRMGGLTRLADGRHHSCRFVNRVPSGHVPNEQISQFHPLVRFISWEFAQCDRDTPSLICVRLPKSASGRTLIEAGQYAFVVQRWLFEGVRVEEFVRARCVALDSAVPLSPEESLELVHAARLYGSDWPEAANDVEADLAAAQIEAGEDELLGDYQIERSIKEAENTDRISFQRQAISAHLERKLEIERSRIRSLGDDPRRRGLVAHSERTMAQMRERFDVQVAQLDGNKARSHYELVAKGVILVDGSER